MSDTSKSHIETLLRLIDDPDPEVREQVMAELRRQAPSSMEVLRDRAENADSDSVRDLLNDVIHGERERPLSDLVKLVKYHAVRETDIDLEEAMILLDSFGRPRADHTRIGSYLDSLALRVHELFITQVHPNELTHVMAMHAVLFEEEGFHGTSEDYYDPNNSYLSSVIESHQGIPVSLAAIELLLADRIGLDMHGVAMPYHFLLYVPEMDQYIDPYHTGNFISREDCKEFIERSGLEFKETMLSPVRNVDIVTRMLRNLSYAHNKRADVWEAQVLGRALNQIQPQDGRSS